MSAQTSKGGLAAFGVDVPEREEVSADAPDESQADDGGENLSIDEFESQDTETGGDAIRSQYLVSGRDVDATADEVGEDRSVVVRELADHGHLHADTLDAATARQVFDECNRDVDALLDAVAEDRRDALVRFEQMRVLSISEFDDDTLRALFEDANRDFDLLHQRVESSRKEVLAAMVHIGAVEEYADYYLHRLWPHEVGLSEMNCGNKRCRAKGIERYPCPECGHEGGPVDE